MQCGLASVLKVDAAFLLSKDREWASPECGSSAPTPTTLADLSGCASLLCTEDELDECGMEDGAAFGDEVEELCGSYRVESARGTARHHRLLLTLSKQPADAPRIGSFTRDDILKQAEARQRRSAPEQRPHRPASCTSSSTSHLSTPADAATAAADMPDSEGGVAAVPPAVARRLPPAHRARMVGWMREVCEALGLHISTLFTAASLLDRFVEAQGEALLPNSLLQLLALTCMSVAVKFNEVQQLGPGVWLSLAVDDSGRPLYQARDLQRCEFSLLQAVEWRLHEPNTFTFLEQFLMACLPYSPPTVETAVTARPLYEPTLEAEAAPGSSCLGAVLGQVAGACAEMEFIASTTASAAAAAAAAAAVGSCTGFGAAAPQRSEAAAAAAVTAVNPAGASAPTWLFVAEAAFTLAEVSQLFTAFLSYEPSTIALACLTLAEGMAYNSGICGGGGAAARPAGAALVAAAAGLPLSLLAPNFETCLRDLELCYEELSAAASAAAEAAGLAGPAVAGQPWRN